MMSKSNQPQTYAGQMYGIFICPDNIIESSPTIIVDAHCQR